MKNTPLNVVFLDSDTISPEINLPPFDFPHNFKSYGSTQASQVQSRILNANILITNKVVLNEEHINAAPNLKLIALTATGFDNIDIQACNDRGITVCNVSDYARVTVAEHVFALVFALRRSIIPYYKSIKAGRWQESGQFSYHDYPIHDLAGATMGIIGSGSLGKATAAIATALGMNVIYAGRKGVANPTVPYTEFTKVLASSDIISLHCPLVESTKNLLAEPEFKLMQRKPLIINTARGGLINERDLDQALRNGLIAGAGIDVTSPEPPPSNSILMGLLDLPNFILTPHIAWASREAMQIMADKLVKNINSFVSGTAINVVN